ncbi:hypothetical protein MSKOL_2039 [Methanosarcina sp. Kolksee]|uniref:SIR2 family protein n=1 Tax=Methanosarcina sp. Kolksee TaxID=1434099 RepID=UPI000615D033|nr:SIR2 family protein [Methanosarcina sp. Kolksee]AKB47816.1 hypothetical protein MSKOL_2039 [Methanosarcina sp. Kolksee]
MPNSNNSSNSNEDIKKPTKAIQPATDAAKALADSIQPATDAAKALADSIQPATDAAKALADSIQPATDAAKALADSIQPATDTAKALADSFQPTTKALIEAFTPMLGVSKAFNDFGNSQMKLFNDTLQSINDRNTKLIRDMLQSISNDNAKLISDAFKPIRESLEILQIDPDYSPKKIDPKKQLENLRKSYRKGKLVLVLGSGISQPYHLPDWETLSKKLLSKQLAKSVESNYIDNIADLLISYNSNFTVLVRNIYQNFKNNSEDQSFEEFVRDVIYEKFDDTKGYDSFEEIKNMMNNLDSIITYNFDDILDEYLEKNGSRKIKTIYDTGTQPEAGQLPIYHVHGFLPREGKLNSKYKITLSEELYHQLYTDVYCWNNIIQINKFTNNTCLFIGTSLTDPNLRRLLDVAKGLREEKSIPHFMLVKHKDEQRLEGKAKFIDKTSKSCEENGILEKEQQNRILETYKDLFITKLEMLEEQDAHSLGIQSIWIDRYDEISTALKEIRDP